jgi:serine/threonine-protein kinase RsbW
VETVSISIPALPAYLQVVRLIASGLSTRLGFTIDEIEDLKIAVDELCAYLTGTQGRDGTLHIDFTIDGAMLRIEGRGEFLSGIKVRTDLTELSQMILSTVVDGASLQQTDGTPTFSLSKTKTA